MKREHSTEARIVRFPAKGRPSVRGAAARKLQEPWNPMRYIIRKIKGVPLFRKWSQLDRNLLIAAGAVLLLLAQVILAISEAAH